MSVPSEA